MTDQTPTDLTKTDTPTVLDAEPAFAVEMLEGGHLVRFHVPAGNSGTLAHIPTASVRTDAGHAFALTPLGWESAALAPYVEEVTADTITLGVLHAPAADAIATVILRTA